MSLCLISMYSEVASKGSQHLQQFKRRELESMGLAIKRERTSSGLTLTLLPLLHPLDLAEN